MFWRKLKRKLSKKTARVRKPSPKYLKHKEEARELVKQRIDHYNLFYKFTYGRIAIKNHKSRWGSCSKKGNLNFNYRIALLPLHLADYIVVHELSHLKEFNHAPAFWSLVALTIPDWQQKRKELMAWRMSR